jgi:hypothetical protein
MSSKHESNAGEMLLMSINAPKQETKCEGANADCHLTSLICFLPESNVVQA